MFKFERSPLGNLMGISSKKTNNVFNPSLLTIGAAPNSIRTPQQMTIAMARHPLCTCQMGIEGTACTIGFSIGVEMKNDARNLAPIGIVFFGVEQAQVRDEVFLVIRCQHRIGGRGIRNIGIERR